jgi:hypothetical protein
MDKKDKGQTQATKWTRKTKDKHRRYNVQQRQRTKTGHTIDKKEKGQKQAIRPLYGLCLSFVFLVHCMAGVCPLSFLSIV